MSNITDLQVSVTREEEKQLLAEGYLSVPGDMNKGTGGNKTNLWYKRGSGAPVTRIQFSFTEKMNEGLKSAGYQKIEKNLNEGAGGNAIFLWYYKGNSEYDVKILALHVTRQADDEAEMFGLNWERISCNLNRRAGGTSVHLWVRRKPAAYVCDVTANADFKGDEDLLKQGYIRVEENTNKDTGGPYIFIWYRLTADPKKAISRMEVSTNHQEYEHYEREGFTQVKQNLNQETGGHLVYLWYKKESVCSPIRTTSIINNPDVAKSYESAGVRVIAKNLNAGNEDSTTLHLYYYQLYPSC